MCSAHCVPRQKEREQAHWLSHSKTASPYFKLLLIISLCSPCAEAEGAGAGPLVEPLQGRLEVLCRCVRVHRPQHLHIATAAPIRGQHCPGPELAVPHCQRTVTQVSGATDFSDRLTWAVVDNL